MGALPMASDRKQGEGRPEFYRFRDLTLENIQRDLHVHTTRTDGQSTIQALLDRAPGLGLREIAYTEHVRRETDWFPEFFAEVDQERQTAATRVWIGIEAKALDFSGGLDASDEILARAEIVLGSVHRIPSGGEFVSLATYPKEKAFEIEFELARGLVRSAPIQVLAHPGGMSYRAFKEFPRNCLADLMRECRRRDVAIEINSSYLLDWDGFLELAERENPYVSIGSDVHRLEHLAQCRDKLGPLVAGRNRE